MMSKEKANTTRRYTHWIVFYIHSKKLGRKRITREGKCWVQKDGMGFNFLLPIHKSNIELSVHDLKR